jgi:hypothetical protein
MERDWVITAEGMVGVPGGPAVFAMPEADAQGAFERLCTLRNTRVILWEPQAHTSEMHEFARHEPEDI